jgi:hypothetical protein
MANLFAMAAPILPGQTERWKKFSKELTSTRFNDFKASRLALGVRERAFLQQTPMGDFVIVTLEGNSPAEALTKFAQGTDAFTKWFAEEVKTIHGFDLQSVGDNPLPELIIDSGELSAAGR